MRFLHIADLHIGKQLNDVSLLEDQKHILEQISGIAENEHVDAVLIAGDVYQKSSPQAEAMALFNAFVTGLAKNGKKVFIISGNHDSEQRIAYFSGLIRDSGVYANECFDGTVQKIAMEDAFGRLNIWMMPFWRLSQARRYFPDSRINDYQDAMAAVLANSPVDRSERNVLLCHQFITGAERSESEEMTVGCLGSVDARLFDDYDYVALGHIHKPQAMTRGTLRYAGSPLKYSLSEADHKKSVVIADIGAKGSVSVRIVPLKPLRDMRIVGGMYEDIMQMPPSDDYVSVILHDEFVPPDAKMDICMSVFPKMIKFGVENSRTKYSSDVLVSESVENKSAEELFSDFYRFQHSDTPPSEQTMEILKKICTELGEKES